MQVRAGRSGLPEAASVPGQMGAFGVRRAAPQHFVAVGKATEGRDERFVVTGMAEITLDHGRRLRIRILFLQAPLEQRDSFELGSMVLCVLEGQIEERAGLEGQGPVLRLGDCGPGLGKGGCVAGEGARRTPEEIPRQLVQEQDQSEAPTGTRTPVIALASERGLHLGAEALA